MESVNDQATPAPDASRSRSPGSESTFSTAFSFTSTMEHRTYREDGGRVFQAVSDDYALPADERETTRLDVQHHAIKTAQGNKNYIAPMHEILNKGSQGDRQEKKVLDIGCGSGIWVMEMAAEFPDASFLGVDLAPTWKDRVNVPDNAVFELCNVAEGISCPDETFDIVHARAMMGGIRDWDALIKELTRILKPGGLLVSCDGSTDWPVYADKNDLSKTLPAEEAQARAPGWCRFTSLTFSSLFARGLAADGGRTTIPNILKASTELEGYQRVDVNLPFWAGPLKSGVIMVEDSKEIPEVSTGRQRTLRTVLIIRTLRLLIIDAAGLSSAEYDTVVKDYLHDLGREGAYTGIRFHNNWAYKKLQEPGTQEANAVPKDGTE